MHLLCMTKDISTSQFIADAMEHAGLGDYLVTEGPHGGLTVMLDMSGIGLIPAGDDSDQCINSGRLSDLMVGTSEEAFQAGFTAGMTFANDTSDEAPNASRAWDRYEPSEAIHELQNSL